MPTAGCEDGRGHRQCSVPLHEGTQARFTHRAVDVENENSSGKTGRQAIVCVGPSPEERSDLPWLDQTGINATAANGFFVALAQRYNDDSATGPANCGADF